LAVLLDATGHIPVQPYLPLSLRSRIDIAARDPGWVQAKTDLKPVATHRLAGSPEPPAEGLRRRPGVVAEEGENRRQEAQLRLGMALLPIREARLGAADLSGYLLLLETAIETDPPGGARLLTVGLRGSQVSISVLSG
jgi:hypothetical protein